VLDVLCHWLVLRLPAVQLLPGAAGEGRAKLPAEVAAGQVRLVVAAAGVETGVSHPGKTQVPIQALKRSNLAGVQVEPSSSLKGHCLKVAIRLATSSMALSLAAPFSMVAKGCVNLKRHRHRLQGL
jgi:hypothetical protein